MNHTTSATHNFFCLGHATHLTQFRLSICLVVNYKEKQLYLTFFILMKTSCLLALMLVFKFNLF